MKLKKIFEYGQSKNFTRRVNILAKTIVGVLPSKNSLTLLDVGCGDGLIDKLVMNSHPAVKITGCDVFVRAETHIPVHEFNGTVLPFPDNSFDYVMFIDVLHHTEDIPQLLLEAARVSTRGILIKDHLSDRIFAYPTLRFMDVIGNERHNVVLPYNYLKKSEWLNLFQTHKLRTVFWDTKISLYPWWASWLFGRGLHFFTVLEAEMRL
jgi:SAM-dependent methyltransferase